jgi:hypothetical protein
MEGPWAWRPSRAAWFDVIAGRASRWASAAPGIDEGAISAAIQAAARERKEWLWHPCLGRLAGWDGDVAASDIRMAVWVAANAHVAAGTISLEAPLAVWTPGGAVELAAGRHDLAGVTGDEVAESMPGPALDLWCHSTGIVEPHSWAESPPVGAADEAELSRQLRTYVRAVAHACELLPACMAWVDAATHVVVPLRGGVEVFRSCSHPSLPGLIALDLMSIPDILEALVHESAHLHLFTAEAERDLVAPDHDDRYPSPLQPLPRPLRGILLAYHALAYICALYRAAAEVPALARWGERLGLNRDLALDAERTLTREDRHLTDAGREFLASTRRVLEHASSP